MSLQTPANPLDQKTIVEGWHRAQRATDALKALSHQAPPITIEQARDLVEGGAIVPMVGAWVYRQAVAHDDEILLDILLDGSRHLSSTGQLHLVDMAAESGAAGCLKKMISNGFPPERASAEKGSGKEMSIDIQGLEHTPRADPVVSAIMRNQVDCVRLLLNAGVSTRWPAEQSLIDKQDTIFSLAESAAMFDLLFEHGLRPVRDDMVKFCLREGPVELLGRFIDSGIKLDPDPKDGSGRQWVPLQVLMRDGGEVMTHSDEFAQRARLLLDAGQDPEREQGAYKLYALPVFLKAGLSIDEVMSVANINYIPAEVDYKPHVSNGDTVEAAAGEQLRELAMAGGNIDVFWDNRAPIAWKRAMIRVGVQPGEHDNISNIAPEILAAGEQARLEYRTKPATGACRSKPRL